MKDEFLKGILLGMIFMLLGFLLGHVVYWWVHA